MTPRILIVRFSSLGDILLTTPLVRAIRTAYPAAWITYVTKTAYLPLIEDNPRINEIVGYDPTRSLLPLANRLNHATFSHRLDLHGSLRSRALRWLVPGRWRTYPKNRLARTALIRLKKDWYKDRRPVAERYFDAARDLAVEPDEHGPEFFIRQQTLERATGFLTAANLRRDKTLVAVVPGARHPTKRWPLEYWQELVGRLAAKETSVVVLGSGEEREIGEAVASAGGGLAVNAAGSVSLAETGALLKLADCAVTGDSGLMHLATAVRTPVVALFGPTVKAFGFTPFRSRATVLEKDLPCRPCSSIGGQACPLGHHNCLRTITVDEVLANVIKPPR